MFTKPKVLRVFPEIIKICLVAGFIVCWLMPVSIYAQAPLPSLKLSTENRLSSDWFLYRANSNQFSLFIPEYHGHTGALYQWVEIRKDRPFLITFTAKKDLCLFINNQLVFTADSVASYTLDLSTKIVGSKKKDQYLLCIWHPTEQPDYTTFKNESDSEPKFNSPTKKELVIDKVRVNPNYNAFVIFLLIIGLLYGWLRTSYSSDFKNLFSISNLLRRSALDEGFLAKPISSWSSILFVIAFSLSFALLIVAIHTNIQNIVIFNRLFAVSEADITSKILFYTILVFAFILFKYLFLKLMGYIFDLAGLVSLQYREFTRTLLFMGMFLPIIMVLYLSFNTTMPQTILLFSTIVVSSILIITVLRIFYTLNKKVSLRNLHLFSYICATEIIPLIILLKLIVFNY